MKRLLVVLVFGASAAHGEIYKWTDSRGTAHYTNNIDEIPIRSRARVKVLDYETGKKPDDSSPLQNGQTQAVKPEEHPAATQAGGPPIQQNAPVPQAVVKRGGLRQQREQRLRESGKSGERHALPYPEE